MWLGGHAGDYTRWRVEATEAIGDSRLSGGAGVIQCELLVYVDELPGHITQGFLSMIAPHHGGIWQDVRVYSTGPLSIAPDGLSVDTSLELIEECEREYTCSLRIEGADPATADNLVLNIVLDLPEPHKERGHYRSEFYVAPDEPAWSFDLEPPQVTFSSSECVELWAPDNPWLLSLTVSLLLEDEQTGRRQISDSVTQRFAFRDIRIEGTEVLLNGEAIKLRSALNWGFYPGAISPSPTREQVREEFAYIKTLGFNAETVCLVNMPDYFYDIADEMGILIWQEYPTWHNDFAAAHLPTYRREFPAYLARDRNHPSIILRSISVEAGVADQEVMAELYQMAKSMTDTPVQDNSSWFWLSNPKLADWYGEDNYLNCSEWARHMLNTLPGKLDELEPKPYIIGESILFNTWPDTAALLDSVGANPVFARPQAGTPAATQLEMAAYLGGPSPYPYWFPTCFASCLAVEERLRARYNPFLPAGEDIVRDYLLPQSYSYALESRRFQIELMDADPRYAGYTVNVVRDMPLIRAGLLDGLGRPRWSMADWAWHGSGGADIPVGGADGPVRDSSEMAGAAARPTQDAHPTDDPLQRWDPAWEEGINRETPVLAVREGYRDLTPLLAQWPNVRWIDDSELSSIRGMPLPTEYSRVVVTSVLTHALADYAGSGGAVILLTSKWPGALGSYHHYFWRDAIFVPPVGPWRRESDRERIVELQMYDLNKESAQVIPVDDLGITSDVDPLLRLFDTHDLSTVVTYDQVFATGVGSGMLIASSLDHSTPAGQWVLGELVRWADEWIADGWLSTIRPFPATAMSPERLHELAVSRANGILALDEGWQFKLDPGQDGEDEGWMLPGYDASDWDAVRAGVGWEAQGYAYDGMAWYRRVIEVPADWEGAVLRLIADGVDDAYTVWVNGEAVATHGSFTVHEETIWLKQTVTGLTGYLIPGESNTLVLQVVDITGQGGIWKPIYLAAD
ncbi:hypothetical protein IIA79_07200 [bacterium]|nr:hypothetical protein [bacterium]